MANHCICILLKWNQVIKDAGVKIDYLRDLFRQGDSNAPPPLARERKARRYLVSLEMI